MFKLARNPARSVSEQLNAIVRVCTNLGSHRPDEAHPLFMSFYVF